MQSSNPVFTRNKAFSRQGQGYEVNGAPVSAEELESMYSAPSATALDTGRMTMDDVVVRTGLMFAVLLPVAGVAYWLNSPLLTMVGLFAGLGLGLVIAFKQITNPMAILSYAGLEGLLVGGLSKYFETQWPGIVSQAVLGTLCVFGAALFAYKSGRVRATPKFKRITLIAGLGYLAFSLVNLGVMLFGGGGQFGLRQGPLGIALGLIAITIAAAFLIMDFDFAEQGVKNGLPERYAWLAAFGLVVTLVWLYLEMLRLIAILRGD